MGSIKDHLAHFSSVDRENCRKLQISLDTYRYYKSQSEILREIQ